MKLTQMLLLLELLFLLLLLHFFAAAANICLKFVFKTRRYVLSELYKDSKRYCVLYGYEGRIKRLFNCLTAYR